ncbi:MAG: mechanosensitive ion channel family protein [Verrucomicrobiales bacterium]|nr:mechanosensitive ion channel family protein [Verrucomicrobiales bacterium]
MMSQTDTPDTIKEIESTLLETVGDMWESTVSRLPYLGAALVVLVITFLVVALAKRIARGLFDRRDVRGSLQDLIVRFLSIGLWFVGLLIVGVIVFPGLDPAKALGGLGLLSVAVGLAFQDIFENFFAGILLLWKFPFEKGDFIECEDIVGRVEDVQIRMSLIRKTTGELVVVPNSFLFKNPVNVMTNRDRRRLHLTAGVGYSENVDEAVSVITSALEQCETVDQEKPIEIYPSGFGASSIDIDVAWWTSSMPGERRRSTGEVVTVIKAALDDAGIEIPFPYRTLTFSEPLKTMATTGNDS